MKTEQRQNHKEQKPDLSGTRGCWLEYLGLQVRGQRGVDGGDNQLLDLCSQLPCPFLLTKRAFNMTDNITETLTTGSTSQKH